jgi:hypothetical protein
MVTVRYIKAYQTKQVGEISRLALDQAKKLMALGYVIITDDSKNIQTK